MIFIGKTDVGKRRANNQDKFDITRIGENAVLLTVCDGMGGANGGNEASRIAISVFTETVLSGFSSDNPHNEALLRAAVEAANTAVYEAASKNEGLKGMGTTLVSALITSDGQASAVNVGDSRLYAYTKGELRQISRDHSYVQYLVDMGQITIKEAKTASIRNIIIRSIGNEPKTDPDLFSFTLSGGDLVLLCSDGLTNCVPVEMLEKQLKEVSEETLDAEGDRLITLANEGGGIDNITVVLGKI